MFSNIYSGIIYYYKIILFLKLMNNVINKKYNIYSIFYVYYLINIHNLLYNINNLNKLYNIQMIKDKNENN